jgi:peptidoglycan/xylan/chitin deacetylase (PgdA/CDA1 family)
MKTVLFSFDIEEFDMPLEYMREILFEDQIKVSTEGTTAILNLLRDNEISATFFSTATFATHSTPVVKRLCQEGHELASHGYFHSIFEEVHLGLSKKKLEEIANTEIRGFRMPRMMPVDVQAIRRAGYSYDASLNPVFLPGRYNNLGKPRTIYRIGDITEMPASATRQLRIPLFWLSFHNFPLWFYKQLCKQTINHDGYLNLYFHPWDFVDITLADYGLPTFVSRNSGSNMMDRFQALISWMKNEGFRFMTTGDFIKSWKD